MGIGMRRKSWSWELSFIALSELVRTTDQLGGGGGACLSTQCKILQPNLEIVLGPLVSAWCHWVVEGMFQVEMARMA